MKEYNQKVVFYIKRRWTRKKMRLQGKQPEKREKTRDSKDSEVMDSRKYTGTNERRRDNEEKKMKLLPGERNQKTLITS